MASPSEPELFQLFDRSPIGMFRATGDGRFIYANPALARLLGYPSIDELLAKNLDADIYVDPDARRQLHERYRPVGGVDGAPVQWRTRDRRILTVQIWGHVVETADGPLYAASVIDVTEVEATTAQLRQTATTLEQVVRLMPAIYWCVDTDLRLTLSGGAVQEVLGYEGNRYLGKTLHEQHAAEPSSVDSVALHTRALNGEVVAYNVEYRGRHMGAMIGPMRDAAGNIIGAIGSGVDVTRLRLLERRMIDAQRAQSLGVLAGGLAHDFNNLLVAVLGNADLALRDIPPGTPGRAAIENIRDAGLRAAELTHQLLTYAGRGGAGTTRVRVAPLVDELVRIIGPSMPAEVRITVDVPADLELRADPAQVRQVVLNMLVNARDAVGQGGRITLVGSRVDTSGVPDPDDVLPPAAGSYTALEVSDDGPGMDAETRRHVFEPFFTTKQTGSGLGLAAVLGIVRAHGGGIRVRSAPGAGARFQILWPPAGRLPRASSPVPIARRTVLVIDDEDLVRDVVARMVEDLGYAAVTAADGAAGLAVVARHSIDAVLVDLTMPDMSGADVIASLRASHPALPVVLCSGYDRDGRGPVKATAYLPKPFRIDALERMLAKLLG